MVAHAQILLGSFGFMFHTQLAAACLSLNLTRVPFMLSKVPAWQQESLSSFPGLLPSSDRSTAGPAGRPLHGARHGDYCRRKAVGRRQNSLCTFPHQVL